MIYPYDVYGKTKSVNEITAGDKARLLGIGYVAINVALTLIVKGILAMYGIPLWLFILLQVILGIFVLIQVLRFMVFREQDKALEETDVFSSYYTITPGCSTIHDKAGTLHTMSYHFGAQFGCIEFKFGMNDEVREKAATLMFNKLIDQYNELNLSHRFIVMDEKFTNSEEAAEMLRKANAITDPIARNTQVTVVNALLEFADNHGSAKSLYLLLYAHSAFVLEDLEEALRITLLAAKKIINTSPFRHIHCLNQGELMEVFRRYYGLGSIDLSLSRSDEANADFTAALVGLYKVVSTEGKSYIAKNTFNLGVHARRLN